MINSHYKFILPPLPYPYDALEPYIDTQTVHIHHDKHFQAYVDNLNKALSQCPRFQNWCLEKLIKNICALPRDIQTSVKNNAGGVYNHNFYFNIMSKDGEREPIGQLREDIIKTFKSFTNFKSELKNSAVNQFGSGWAWLVLDPRRKLKIISTANQDTPLSLGLRPILTVDVWEHAYYLKYQNRRPEYVDNWFNLIDWKLADDIYCKYIKPNR